jgi:hypothetical protein
VENVSREQLHHSAMNGASEKVTKLSQLLPSHTGKYCISAIEAADRRGAAHIIQAWQQQQLLATIAEALRRAASPKAPEAVAVPQWH